MIEPNIPVHDYVGRTDRVCDLCGQPDRAVTHPQEAATAQPDPDPQPRDNNPAFLAHAHGIGTHTECWCATCEQEAKEGLIRMGVMPAHMAVVGFMHLCPDCQNKRCPRATFHENACTGSNDPGQSGSRY